MPPILPHNKHHTIHMKRIILPTLALCCALTAAADTSTGLSTDIKPGFSSVVVTSPTGETTTITLTDAMVTSFTAADAIFSDGTNEVTIPLANLRSYTFVEAVIPEGINAPLLNLGDANAEIFTLDGRLVRSASSLSLDGLQTGTYIVRSGNRTIKVNHK